MLKYKRITIISLVLLVCLLINVGVAADAKPQPIGYNQALFNIRDFGAIPNDGIDDTLAFKVTLNAGESVYVPAGVYEISEPLLVKASVLMGEGTDKTVIVANFKSTRNPIIWAGDKSQIRDLTIKFADNCIKGNEIAGERCGIITTAERNLCRGAAISNVRIQNVGTGIYSPMDGIISDASTTNGTAFSVTFESISVIDFAYRGIDMQGSHRTGNVYRNIYLSSGKYEANIAFVLGRVESEASISELVIADSKLKLGAHFDGIYGANVSNITFINTELTSDNTAFMYFDETSITINNFVLKNSAPKGAKQSFIRVGDGAYRASLDYDNGGYLKINNMSILNDKVNTPAVAEQYVISRENGYIHGYNVIIDNYSILSAPKKLKAQYEKFNFDNRAVTLWVNGKNLTEGEK